MPAPESAPIATSLHQSIEQLIAETLKQSQSTHEAEVGRLNAALRQALGEIESSQQALVRAADALRSALESREQPATAETGPPAAPKPAEIPSPPIVREPEPNETSSVPTNQRGAHELDVIAHGASFTDASGLQTMLRERGEVNSAVTREFVNGELRLHLTLTSTLDRAALDTWLAQHGGVVAASTDSVVEIRFEG